MMSADRCFACNRRLTAAPKKVRVANEDTIVHVGPDCARRIEAAGDKGWQPSNGGPRLYQIMTVEEFERSRR